MKEMKVSLCISVHNTEKYLERCLNSVARQTLLEKEIILVDNGSTDNSLRIMKEFEEKNSDLIIKIITQEDKGLAQGRQTGINNATGEYVAFLDADDYIYERMLEDMYQKAVETQADIVECEAKKDNKVEKSPFKGILDSKIVLREYLNGRSVPPMLWLRLYKKELFKRDVLPKFYVNNEDEFALPCLLYMSKRIYFLNKPLYHYSTDNLQGVMNSSNRSENKHRLYERYQKLLLAIPHFENFISEEDYKELKPYIDRFKLRIIMCFCTTTVKNISSTDKLKQIDESLNISEHELTNFVRSFSYTTSKIVLLIKLFGAKKGIFIFDRLNLIMKNMALR